MDFQKFLTDQEISENLKEGINCVAKSIIKTSNIIESAPLLKNLGKLKKINIQGEQQTKLDVDSNDIFVDELKKTKSVIGAVSEEVDEEIIFDKVRSEKQLLVFFDPLDGSSNVEANVSVGSIFSIYEVPHKDKLNKKDFLQKGKQQIAAGFSVFGPSIQLVITFGKGTFKFCLDRAKNNFVLIDENIKIPLESEEFAINMSNERYWGASTKKYIKDCQLGALGPRGKNFNMRYIASLVADVNRILTRGGIYLYPRDNKEPKRLGRLRLMYEINPMAFIVEQCNGLCTDGIEHILNIQPQSIHERVPVVIGAKNEVKLVSDYYQQHQNSETVFYK
jgi:fructose-1,6-bisphosphatase